MSKKKIIAFILLIIVIGIHFTKSIAGEEESNKEFFTTNKTEISQGETLEMILDISKIKYNKFDFKLSSNLDTNNIVINEDIKVESFNNDINISIDKSKTNLNKITFYYKIPENSQVGTKIELVAQIIVEEESAKEEILVSNTTENTSNVVNKTENKSNTTINTTNKNVGKTAKIESNVVENKKINIKIVEKIQNESQEKEEEKKEEKNNTDKSNKISEKASTNTIDKTEKTQSNETKKETQKTSLSTSSVKATNSSTQAENEKAVYSGSNNNYLSNIEVEGENLNTEFNKENSTYFIETTGKTVLNVNTIKEDSTSKVHVTGNENLKTGDNKILISVTAENGDVRYYRIFVTNK